LCKIIKSCLSGGIKVVIKIGKLYNNIETYKRRLVNVDFEKEDL